MKTVLLFLVLLYGVHCTDKIHPKEPGTAGEPKAELMVQRLTLPVQWVGALYWNEDEKMLGYSDVMAATYHIWYRETGKTDQVHLKEFAGHEFKFVLPIKNNLTSHLAAVDGELRIVTNSSNTFIVSKPVLKLNDTNMKITNGHCDPKGRLFFGTCASCNSVAKLYKVENGKPQVMATMDRCIDDLTWSMNSKKFYVISNGLYIWEYSYDMNKGTLGDNPKLAFSILDHLKFGTAITSIETDDNGTMWVSVNSGMILNVDPNTCEILKFVKIPGECTKMTFGGDKNKYLYVGTKKSCPIGRIGEGSVYVVSGFKYNGSGDRSVYWPK